MNKNLLCTLLITNAITAHAHACSTVGPGPSNNLLYLYDHTGPCDTYFNWLTILIIAVILGAATLFLKKAGKIKAAILFLFLSTVSLCAASYSVIISPEHIIHKTFKVYGLF